MKVEDVITRDVKFCSPGTNLAAAAEIMRRNKCSTLPVLDASGAVLGLVTDHDMFITLGKRNWRPSDLAIRDLALTKVTPCGPHDDVHEALRIMRKQQVGRVPVVDESGHLVGVVSLDDLVLHAEKEERKRSAGISYDDVVRTLKATCRHRAAHRRPGR
jgi:CBS domain-containing protein